MFNKLLAPFFFSFALNALYLKTRRYWDLASVTFCEKCVITGFTLLKKYLAYDSLSDSDSCLSCIKKEKNPF